jgi:hypothetical protein
VSLTTKAVELASHHGVLDTISCEKICQWLWPGCWFSLCISQVAGFLFVLRFLSSIKYICVNIYMWLKATLNTNNYLTTTYWYLDNWQIAIAWIGWRLSIRKFMKYRILLSCYHTTRYRLDPSLGEANTNLVNNNFICS